MALNTRDTATILAALRFWQASPLPYPGGRFAYVLDIATSCGDVEPLSNEEINTLCEQIKCPRLEAQLVEDGTLYLLRAAIARVERTEKALRLIRDVPVNSFSSPEVISQAFNWIDDMARAALGNIELPAPLEMEDEDYSWEEDDSCPNCGKADFWEDCVCKDTPDDTPSLDTSFHDHEMDVD